MRFALAAAALALLAAAPSAARDAADPELPGIVPLKDRARAQDAWLKERLDTLVPRLMRANKVDMWILVAREYAEDPVVKTMLPATWVSARRRTVLVFFDRGEGRGVERLALARYPVGDFQSAWNPEQQPDQWAAIAKVVQDRQPRQIAVNISDGFALADGLTVSQHRALTKALGPLAARMVSHDALALGWLETRVPAEMAAYGTIMRTAHAVLAEGLSEKAITPGVTTTDDVVWWYRERLAALKLDVWCQPSVNVQRADTATFAIGGMVKDLGEVIRPGDLVHVDFCVDYMGLKTDTQQMAYVLRPGETAAPKGLRDGFAAANAVQDALTAQFRTGRTGDEMLALGRRAAIARGLKPIIYTHAIGYHGHAAGPWIGAWENQEGVPDMGRYPVNADTAWSIELAALHKVPEWGGQEVRFMLEVDGYFDGRAFRYVDGRQTGAPPHSAVTILIPVLGDQLSHDLASLRDVDRSAAVVLMVEVREETGYVRHHKKKIALIFSAMRHFAAELREAGWTVDYVTLDDPANTHGFTGEVARAAARHGATAVRVVEGAEYRVRRMQDGWAAAAGVPVEILADDRFVCPIDDFLAWADGRRDYRMEYFYRDMRRRTGLLMTADGRPEGGRWNFDHDNRETPPRGLNYPLPERVEPDAITREVLALVGREFAGHFGDLKPFALPVTRTQALAALRHFVATALPDFGRYEDAMIAGQDYLYHSVLSPCINLGLLSPLEVCRAVEAAYRAGDVPINSAEGYIRQIIGWREYMRGMYWRDMPAFADRNALAATRPLPDFYWTGETDMRCMAEGVGQTKREAYAHHIQRLMVLGNFALIAGVSPQAISDWFLVVYFDAYEWVELPNVVGMSQFADGGAIASKPYASTGAYIDRMSDYCGRCRYDVKQRTGPDACPYNALYWDFIGRHADRLAGNPRMRNMLATWRRFSDASRAEIRESAAAFLDGLEPAADGWAR